MIVRRFVPADLDAIDIQPSQRREFVENADLQALVAISGPAWTAVDSSGRIIASAGIAVLEGRAVAWSLLAEGFTGHLRPLMKAMRAVLSSWPTDVICAVRQGNAKAARFANALGFAFEQGQDPEQIDVYVRRIWVPLRPC